MIRRLSENSKETLWRSEQRTRALNRLILEMRWEDSAAKVIQQRYLRPHEIESQEMLRWFKKQFETIEQVEEHLLLVYLHIQIATGASSTFEHHIQHTNNEMQAAEALSNIATMKEAHARAMRSEVYTLIQQANQAGS